MDPRRSAYTLIELALVALLIMTVVGLSMPMLKKTFIGLYAQDTSFNISKLANYAQEMAVLERANYKVSFNFQDGKYQLFAMDASTTPPSYKKAGGRFGRAYSVDRALKIAGAKKDVVFYPDGHCDEFSVKVFSGSGGYIVHAKRFGNAVEVKEASGDQ